MTLKQLRESKGLTQKQAAALAGCNERTIKRIENGHTATRTDTEHRARKILLCYQPPAR